MVSTQFLQFFFYRAKQQQVVFFKKSLLPLPHPPITSSFHHLSGTGVLSSSNGGLTGLASWRLEEATDRALRVRAPPRVPVFNYWVSFPFFYSFFLSPQRTCPHCFSQYPRIRTNSFVLKLKPQLDWHHMYGDRNFAYTTEQSLHATGAEVSCHDIALQAGPTLSFF